MLHIRQKGSSLKDGEVYTIVNHLGYEDNLELHPAIVERPDLYEIVDTDIPIIQRLNYSSNET